jgi:nitrite reductase/ring-hydroxylating ferredoxin subunit
MKKYFLILIVAFLFSCNKDKTVTPNQYIPEYSFSTIINTSLPSYSNLQFPSNPVLITNAGAGIKGIIVMKVGTDDYRAFEASCPNQYPTDCTLLTINGINAKCPCDGVEYSLYTGIGSGQYPLKAYKIEVLGANLRVYN